MVFYIIFLVAYRSLPTHSVEQHSQNRSHMLIETETVSSRLLTSFPRVSGSSRQLLETNLCVHPMHLFYWKLQKGFFAGPRLLRPPGKIHAVHASKQNLNRKVSTSLTQSMQQIMSRTTHVCQIPFQHLAHQMPDLPIHPLQTAQGVDDVLKDLSPQQTYTLTNHPKTWVYRLLKAMKMGEGRHRHTHSCMN